MTPVTVHLSYALADEGVPPARVPPNRPKMFSISCSFLGILVKWYVDARRIVGAPPTGNPGSTVLSAILLLLRRKNGF